MNERIHNQQNLKNCRHQNRTNLTPAEAELWRHLQESKLEGRKFRRQHSVGKYIIDFYCPQEKLGIELDGRDHFTDNGYERDEERTKYLNSINIKMLRFENKEVFEQLEGVVAEITARLPPPTPPKTGGELWSPEIKLYLEQRATTNEQLKYLWTIDCGLWTNKTKQQTYAESTALAR